VIADCERSAALLGFESFHLNLSDAMNISFADAHVAKVLELIAKTKIDTLVTIWEHDAHPAHKATHAIAMAATRNVPNVLTVQLSWNKVRAAGTWRTFHSRGWTQRGSTRPRQRRDQVSRALASILPLDDA
jgi:prepilin-type processing-associated H-X9-DG protein